MTDKPLPSLMPALYSHRLADIQAVAKQHGYAIAVHGSMQRDLDLVAIPWSEYASPSGHLVMAMGKDLDITCESIEAKPHGRRAVTFLMGGACFMDLSIMPTVESKPDRIYIADNYLYYLRSILRQLTELQTLVHATQEFGPTIGGEVYADNLEWLDCHIDAVSRAIEKPEKQSP